VCQSLTPCNSNDLRDPDMDTLRQRNPFKFSSEYSESDDTYIMDEQGDKVNCFVEVLILIRFDDDRTK
jgi:hypothetical protein